MRHTLWKMKMRPSSLYIEGEDGLLPVWSGGGWDVRRVTHIHVVQGGVRSWGWWRVQDLKRANKVYFRPPLAKPSLQLASLGSGSLFSTHGPQTSLELVNLESRRETSAIFPRADGGQRHGNKVLLTQLSLSLSGITLLTSRDPSGPQSDLGHEHQADVSKSPGILHPGLCCLHLPVRASRLPWELHDDCTWHSVLHLLSLPVT